MSKTLTILIVLFFSALAVRGDDCDGRVKRHFTIQTLPLQEVEVGYTWSFSGNLVICGQCGFANAPGAPPTPGNPFTVVMDWGDGALDPLSISAGDANLYRYVSNSPIVRVDSAGLIPAIPWDQIPQLIGVIEKM